MYRKLETVLTIASFEAIILKHSTSNVDTESDSSLDGFIITINFAKFSSVTGSIPTKKITKVSKLAELPHGNNFSNGCLA